MVKRYKLTLDTDAADALVVAVLKDTIAFRAMNKKYPPHPDDLAYQKEYTAAVKIVLKHFGR
jgi:hypothetical protein